MWFGEQLLEVKTDWCKNSDPDSHHRWLLRNKQGIFWMLNTKSFNFCIGTEWPGTDQLCIYRIRNTDIHYGSMKTAQSLLNYVQQQSPGQAWRIIRIYNDPAEWLIIPKTMNYSGKPATGGLNIAGPRWPLELSTWLPSRITATLLAVVQKSVRLCVGFAKL